MTLVDRPLIQYAIDEARAAGITDFIFLTSRGKGALEDYFDHAPMLVRALRKRDKQDLLDFREQSNMNSGEDCLCATTSASRTGPCGVVHATTNRRRTLRRHFAR